MAKPKHNLYEQDFSFGSNNLEIFLFWQIIYKKLYSE